MPNDASRPVKTVIICCLEHKSINWLQTAHKPGQARKGSYYWSSNLDLLPACAKADPGIWKGKRLIITYCKLQSEIIIFTWHSHVFWVNLLPLIMQWQRMHFSYVWLRKTGTNNWFFHQTCLDSNLNSLKSEEKKGETWDWFVRLLTSGQAQGSGTLLSLFLHTLSTLRDFRQCMTAVGRLVRRFSDTSSSCSLRRPIQFVPDKHKRSTKDTFQSLQNSLYLLLLEIILHRAKRWMNFVRFSDILGNKNSQEHQIKLIIWWKLVKYWSK